MRIQRALILALGATAIACSPPSSAEQGQPSQPPAQVAGGWSALDPASADATAAAQAALPKLPGGDARLVRIVSAQQQVVAGMNYRLTLALADGSQWDVTVWRRLSGEWELTSSTALPPAPEPEMQLAAGGISVTGTDGRTRLIPFGTGQADVMAAIAFRGPAGESTNAECGVGPVQFASWPDGVNLLFQGGTFGGWSLDPRAGSVTTTTGLAPGSTLADVRQRGQATVEESTLGTEFTAADGMGGLLDGKGGAAKVTDLWAGLTCQFR